MSYRTEKHRRIICNAVKILNNYYMLDWITTDIKKKLFLSFTKALSCLTTAYD